MQTSVFWFRPHDLCLIIFRISSSFPFVFKAIINQTINNQAINNWSCDVRMTVWLHARVVLKNIASVEILADIATYVEFNQELIKFNWKG